MDPAPPAWTRWLPGLAQLAGPGGWRADAQAGVAVAIVMIPSVLAYAELVGLPAANGLYAAAGAMAAYLLVARSRRIVVGPDTTIALLAASIVAPLAAGDPARAAALAATLALMAGAVLVVAARIGLGRAADALSRPVLIGYANGAALVLIVSQLPALLGLELPSEASFASLLDIVPALPRAHVPTLGLGLALVALLLVLRRRAPRAPGPLVACAAAALALEVPGLRDAGIAMLAAVPAGLPAPALPAVGFDDLRALAPGAIALAFLVFAEGILLARTLADRHREPVDASGELRALGFANLGAGALGGFNVGASGSRSITADAAGARSQRTQLVALLLLVAFVFLLAPALGRLPRVALAAILAVAGWHLLDLAGTRALRRLDPPSFWLANAVTLGVLVLGVLPGMLVGVALAVARLLADVARPRDALLRRSPGDNRFHDLDDDEPGATPPGVIVYRLYAPLVFANARHVAERIDELVVAADPPARLVVLDLQAVPDIDVTAIEFLADLHDRLEGAGIDLRFARANRPLREQVERMLAGRPVAHERFFPSSSAAVDDFLSAQRRHPAS